MNSMRLLMAAALLGLLMTVASASVEIAATEDVYVDSGYANTNYAGTTDLYLGKGTYWDLGYWRSYFAFDLSDLAGEQIQSAELWVYQYSAGPAAGGLPCDAHRVIEDWDEATITWNNKPGHDPTIYDSEDVGDSFYTGWIKWDITSLVQDWVDGIVPNQGVVLKHYSESPAGASRYGIFYSQESAQTDRRPKLVVELAPPPPDTDVYVSSLNANTNYAGTTDLYLGKGTYWDLGYWRSYFSFDLSDLAGEQIQSAELWIYQYSAGPAAGGLPCDAHRVIEDWDEATITWNNKPAYDPTVYDSEDVGNSFYTGWIKWNITPLVQDWVDGIVPNQGVVLKHYSESPAGASRYGIFYSQESAQTDLRPKLVVDTATGADDLALLPVTHVLYPNQPNPFNPQTEIRYALPSSQRVELAVFDINGRRLKVLVNQIEETGEHIAFWDGTDGRGQALASGVYFYRLVGSDFEESRSMTLIR